LGQHQDIGLHWRGDRSPMSRCYLIGPFTLFILLYSIATDLRIPLIHPTVAPYLFDGMPKRRNLVFRTDLPESEGNTSTQTKIKQACHFYLHLGELLIVCSFIEIDKRLCRNRAMHMNQLLPSVTSG
jgi:hypothetical protein